MAKQPVRTVNDNQPLHAVRHRNLKASIWRNETEKGPMFNVTLVRSYREGETWHDSHSFSYDDLMNAAKLLYDAHSFITSERAREAAQAKLPVARPNPKQSS
jgi:hypothetical protein